MAEKALSRRAAAKAIGVDEAVIRAFLNGGREPGAHARHRISVWLLDGAPLPRVEPRGELASEVKKLIQKAPKKILPAARRARYELRDLVPERCRKDLDRLSVRDEIQIAQYVSRLEADKLIEVLDHAVDPGTIKILVDAYERITRLLSVLVRCEAEVNPGHELKGLVCYVPGLSLPGELRAPDHDATLSPEVIERRKRVLVELEHKEAEEEEDGDTLETS